MTIERHVIYKVFLDGQYLGLLPNVKSEFSYSQDINTGSTELTVLVGQSLDNASDPVEPITDEYGVPITTEAGDIITTERATDVVGLKGSGSLVANDNDIEAWEYSDDNPNGVLAFDGYITRWFGNVGSSDDIEVIVTSHSKDLDDYIFGNSAFSLQISQTTGNGADGTFIGPGSASDAGAQTITPGSSFDCTKITTDMAALDPAFFPGEPGSVTVTMELLSGTPSSPTALLSSASVLISNLFDFTAGSYSTISFILPSAVTLTSGQTYHMRYTGTDDFIIRNSSGSVYAGGSFFKRSAGVWSDSGNDMLFGIYTGNLLTDATFTATDPSDMVRDALDGYGSQGGVVTYTGSSIDSTGLSLDYSFITATVLEIINKARDLAPQDWYWFVDPATQILTFKEVSTTADHTFILGEHIESFELDANIQAIKNVIYFTGGPTAGTNLLKLYTDTDSLAENRRGMERLSDNRVTSANEPAAQAIADSYLAEHSSETFSADIEISAETYDISTIDLGQTVAFGGYTNFVKDLVVPIVSKTRYTDRVRLRLGKLQYKSDVNIDQISRDLAKQQTLDNPNTPS